MPTALVTGAAQRIGRAIALRLSRAGYTIAIHYGHSEDEAFTLQDDIRREGNDAFVVQADLKQRSGLENLMSQARQRGDVTVLVNNASIFEPDDVATLCDASWDAHMAVNLAAPLFLIKAFAQALPDSQKGCVVNLLDQRVLKPVPHFLSYGISKAALYGALVPLAQALAPRIRVNAVAPGPTLKNMRQSEQDFDRQCRALLLGEGVSCDAVAEAVLYLTEAQHVTGQMITVDGGQHLAWETPDVRGIPE